MRKFLTPLLFALTSVAAAQADISLHALFTDHAVFQSGKPVPVWGWASPSATITVRIGEQEHKTQTGKDGQWRVTLAPLVSGQSYEMTVTGDGERSVKDIVAGEVWLCSGQSNMQWPVKKAANAVKEAAAAQYPGIRLFTVKTKASATPEKNVEGQWQVCTPETAPEFSAIGYYFGRKLHADLASPVGLINSSWGGTPIEAWTPLEALKTLPFFAQSQKQYENEVKNEKAIVADHAQDSIYWNRHKTEWNGDCEDPGNRAVFRGWADPEFDDSAWKKCQAPTDFVTLGLNLDGVVWFRKSIEIPPEWEGMDLTLHINRIDDMDTTYFNGNKIGATGKETEKFWEKDRRYTVPATEVKAGKALIAIRIFDKSGNGGFLSDPLFFRIVPTYPDSTAVAPRELSLAGEWRYSIEHQFEEPKWKVYGQHLLRLKGSKHEHAPGNLYCAMIHSLTSYPIAGALWYQGENNVGKAANYASLLKTMISSWRSAWSAAGVQDLPFFVVQLANYNARKSDPASSAWAELRESQAQVLSLKKTGLVTAVDLGADGSDIHPKDKQEVGRRLALSALATVYGKPLITSGPSVKKSTFSDGVARIEFDSVAAGLQVKGQALKSFAVAGENRRFYWAHAVLEGDTLTLRAPEVPHPVAARYAWADNPEITLYNSEGLPAFPFRTDDWPKITEDRR